MIFKYWLRTYAIKTLYIIILSVCSKSILAAYYHQPRKSSPEHTITVLRLKEERLKRLWQEATAPDEIRMLTHLVRKAYSPGYTVPAHALFLLKSKGFDPENDAMLYITRTIFELVEPEDPDHSAAQSKRQ